MKNLPTNILIFLLVIAVIVIFNGGTFFSSPTVTMSKYEQIRNDITYYQVTNIIGKSGVEISRNHMPAIPGVMSGIDTVMYQWVNPGGSNMNAMFQNDRLISKAQFGLK